MKLTYLPKLHSFEMDTMIIMTMLAAVQNNLCAEGGNLMVTYVVRAYSRANTGYVLRNRNTYDNITFKKLESLGPCYSISRKTSRVKQIYHVT